MLEKATGKKFLSHALLGFLKGCVIRTNLMKMELDNVASKTILHLPYWQKQNNFKNKNRSSYSAVVEEERKIGKKIKKKKTPVCFFRVCVIISYLVLNTWTLFPSKASGGHLTVPLLNRIPFKYFG